MRLHDAHYRKMAYETPRLAIGVQFILLGNSCLWYFGVVFDVVKFLRGDNLRPQPTLCGVCLNLV